MKITDAMIEAAARFMPSGSRDLAHAALNAALGAADLRSQQEATRPEALTGGQQADDVRDLSVFARRWSIAKDGFGVQRDDADGCYVHIDDALDVLHAAITASQSTPVPADQREPLYRAAISCPHEIDHNKVVLHFDAKQGGKNALNQLARRLEAAATISNAGVPEPVNVSAVAEVAGHEDGPILNWFLEGGIHELPEGVVLLVADRRITDECGRGEVYTLPALSGSGRDDE